MSSWVRNRLRRVAVDMLHWIDDVRQIDGIADWSWHFLQSLSWDPGPEIKE